jgi:hypothetical protein
VAGAAEGGWLEHEARGTWTEKAALGQSEDAAEWGGPWEGADHTEGGHTTTVPNPPPGLAAGCLVARPPYRCGDPSLSPRA